MATTIDATSAAFLLSETRNQPMHVGGLQLFKKPPDAGRSFAREMYRMLRPEDGVTPLFSKRPRRARTRLFWEDDDQFDIDHHVRHSALPKPGRIRELLELCSRLHGTRLDWERPLWEAHLIEGLRDGRLALYTKTHHALLDGVAAMRLIRTTMSTDPELRGMPAPWAASTERRRPVDPSPLEALRTALEVTGEAAGLPSALAATLRRSRRHESAPISFNAPKTMLNQPITASRRFAAQDWPLERLRTLARASRTTLNDVVLAMCAGALRAYLSEQSALPEEPLIAMVPVSLDLRAAFTSSSDGAAQGGNALGSVMVPLGTDLPDPAARLALIHASMRSAKESLSELSPLQITALSGLGQAPAILGPLLGLSGKVRPAYNLVISNVPGPRTPLYFNGAEMTGSYPMSIVLNGMALNITCTSYAGSLCFGVIGCRRTVPHLQRLLGHLDDELGRLEAAAG